MYSTTSANNARVVQPGGKYAQFIQNGWQGMGGGQPKGQGSPMYPLQRSMELPKAQASIIDALVSGLNSLGSR